jgi:hypothetical protein
VRDEDAANGEYDKKDGRDRKSPPDPMPPSTRAGCTPLRGYLIFAQATFTGFDTAAPTDFSDRLPWAISSGPAT